MENQLATYIPASIVSHVQMLLSRDPSFEAVEAPFVQSYETVVMFADVSGFTAMCEAMSALGAGGDEKLAEYLNSYFSMLVKIVSSQGGDVFKFAGDALLVLWPEDDGDSQNRELALRNKCRRAVQCAQEIKSALRDAKIGSVVGGVTLNVKIGLGVGKVNILHVGGGPFGRVECVATGDPLLQAFSCEHQATKSEVVLSRQVWEQVSEFFPAHDLTPDGFVFMKVLDDLSPEERKLYKIQQPNQLSKRNVYRLLDSAHTNSLSVEAAEICQEVLKRYVPRSVLPYLVGHEERWVSEIRRITVLFVNVGIAHADLVKDSSSTSGITRMQKIVRTVQQSIFAYEGSLNKFLLDDKGSTMLAVFGLPPLAHHDDAIRGVFTALSIVEGLKALKLRPSVGITTGRAFCGVVGSRGRREYSVLGDVVNVAARLMQHATNHRADVVVDTATWYATRHRFDWPDINPDTIHVKGKSELIRIFTPALQKKRLRLGFEAAMLAASPVVSPSASPVHPSSAAASASAPGVPIAISANHPAAPAASVAEPPSPVSSASGDGFATPPSGRLRAIRVRMMGSGEAPLQWRRRNRESPDFTTSPLFLDPPSDDELSQIGSSEDPPSAVGSEEVDGWGNEEGNVLKPHKETLRKAFRSLLVKRKSSTVIVEGRMGMGKSRLVHEILREIKDPVLGVRMLQQRDREKKKKKDREKDDEGEKEVKKGSKKDRAAAEIDAVPPFLDVGVLCDSLNVDHPLQVWADVVCQLVDAFLSPPVIKAIKPSASGGVRSRVLTAEEELRNAQLERESERKALKKLLRQREAWILETLEDRGQQQHAAVLQPLFPELSLAPASGAAGSLPSSSSSSALARKRAASEAAALASHSPESLAILTELLVAMIEKLAAERPLVVFLDDAMRMSGVGWHLLLQLQEQIRRGLLLVLATRPINSFSAAPQVLEPYAELTQRKVRTLRIPARQARVIAQIALAAFSENEAVPVVSVSGMLMDLIIAKCRGTPLLVKELVYALKKGGLVRVSGGSAVIVPPKDNQFADEQEKIRMVELNMPVPDTLQDNLGARIDRLSMPEVLVLKTAAVVGEVFSFAEVQAAFPIATYKARISDILRTVVLKGFIKVAKPARPQAGTGGWETTYQFVHGFMRDTLLSRMLEQAQQNFLRSRLIKPGEFEGRAFKHLRSELEPAQLVGPVWVRDKLMELPRSFLGGADCDPEDEQLGSPDLAGRRRVDEVWKPAWLALHRQVALVWWDRAAALGPRGGAGESASSDPASQPQPQPFQTFLLGSLAAGLPGELLGGDESGSDEDDDDELEGDDDEEEEDLEETPPPKELCFALQAKGWMREGDWHSEKAQLLIATHSPEQRDLWLQSIRSAVAQAKQEERSLHTIRKLAAIDRQGSGAEVEEREAILEFKRAVSMAASAPALMEQQLQMQKQTHALFSRVWKRRWFTLTEDSLYVRKKRLSPHDPDFLRPQQVAGLAWGRCSCVEVHKDQAAGPSTATQWSPPQSGRGANLWLLSLQFEFHMKGGEFRRGPKQFLLGCSSESELKTWVQRINEKINRAKQIRARRLEAAQQQEEQRNRHNSDSANLPPVHQVILEPIIRDKHTEWSQLRLQFAAKKPSPGLLNESASDAQPLKPLYSPLEVARTIDEWLAGNPDQLHSQVGSLLHSVRNLMVADISQAPSQAVQALAGLPGATGAIPASLPELKLRGDLDTWAWSIWDYEEHELASLCGHLFARYQPVFEEFGIPMRAVNRLIACVERNYLMNPYHNFRHAVDVVQVLHVMLLQCGGASSATRSLNPLARLRYALTPMDRLCLLVAGLCHDVSHPGTDNVYQAKAKTPVHALYGQLAGGLLENHHSVATFSLLARNPDCNLMNFLKDIQRSVFRETVHQSIMATDMGKHFALTAQFQKLVDDVSAEPTVVPAPTVSAAGVARLLNSSSSHGDLQSFRSAARHASNSSLAEAAVGGAGGVSSVFVSGKGGVARETRQLLLDIMLHAADISNPTRPWAACKRWCDQILVEFAAQGRLEAARGLEVGPNNIPEIDQNQFSIKFIDFIVSPLFKECWRLFVADNPQRGAVDAFMAALRDNRAMWSSGLSKEVYNSGSWQQQEQKFLALLPPELKEADSDVPPPPPPHRSSRKKTKESSSGRGKETKTKRHRNRSEADAGSGDVPPPPPPPLP